MKTYDYINRVVLTLPLSVYEGTWTTLSPLVAMHHLNKSLFSENNKECAKVQSPTTIYIFARVCIIGSLVPFV